MSKKTVMPEPKKAAGQLETLTVERRLHRSDNYVVIYSNDTQVQTTPWDIRLIFGRIQSAPTQQEPVLMIEQVGEVSMSLQHAKRVASILQNQINSYEEKIGPIVLATDEIR